MQRAQEHFSRLRADRHIVSVRVMCYIFSMSEQCQVISPEQTPFEELSPTQQAAEWTNYAACFTIDESDKDSLFFADKDNGSESPAARQKLAKRVCEGCVVRDRCLDYALSHDERFGVWGGLTEAERRRLKKLAVRRAA